MPSEAMIKANSPICASEQPQRTARCRLWPESSTPSEDITSLPTIVTSVRIRIGTRYFTIIAGSISMPTDRKKTLPKRSFTPEERCSTRSACTVPAISDPARKAPSAEEKPSFSARSTMPKHKPSELSSSVSSFV